MSNIIYLQIDGAESYAWVTEIAHRHHRMFKVLFNNDYENIFYTDVETGRWIEEDIGYTELADQVGSQIKNFIRNPIHVPKLLVWHNQEIDNKLLCFGFTSLMKGNHKLYEIYNSNKKYLYTLVDMDNDEWQILGNTSSLLNKIDTAFIEHVINVLPLYSANAR